jgi:hypothetical protein
VWRALALVSSLAILACGHHGTDDRGPPELETTIARALTTRFGVPVTTRCAVVADVPVSCQASVVDGTVLPIALERTEAGVRWQVAGPVIETAPIARYVGGVLADLGIAQRAACGPVVQRLVRGQRLACTLSGGGAAFVQVAANGALSLELALDPATAVARGSAAADAELLHRSRALDKSDEAGEPAP